VPWHVSVGELEARLDAVLKVIYLAFNEGYSATSGATLVRTDLCAEAIRLARRLREECPIRVPELEGLLALMLIQDSRRAARVNDAGDLVPLPEQNRDLWNRGQIEEGQKVAADCPARRRRRTLCSTSSNRCGTCSKSIGGGDGLETDRRDLRTVVCAERLANRSAELCYCGLNGRKGRPSRCRCSRRLRRLSERATDGTRLEQIFFAG